MNTVDDRVAQTKPTMQIIKFSGKKFTCSNRNNPMIKAATVIGKTQYPMTQSDWKKEMVPPSSWAFKVMTDEPNQTATNTAANTKLA